MVCPLCYVSYYFYNFREDVYRNRTNVTFLTNYRDRPFPFLIECYAIKKPLLQPLLGPFYKTYDGDGNILRTISLSDLSVNIGRC